MTHAGRTLLLVGALIIAGVPETSDVSACSCARAENATEAKEIAAAVFSGLVVSRSIETLWALTIAHY